MIERGREILSEVAGEAQCVEAVRASSDVCRRARIARSSAFAKLGGVEGAGRVTSAFGLGASPRTPPAPAVPRAPRGCFWVGLCSFTS